VTEKLVIERLGPHHDRASFACGVPALDRYLHEFALQDIRRRLANCFVAIEADGRTLRAFYTLAATGVQLSDLPETLTRRLPRYPVLPAVLIGRLAVDRRHQRSGLGAALLADAALRAGRSEPAVHLLVIDAKNEAAADFYRRHGFRSLTSRPMSLVLPLGTAGSLQAGE
jgi:ribosomal protein S18 acetylase RimI-like enzyme